MAIFQRVKSRYRRYKALKEAKRLVDGSYYSAQYPDTLHYKDGAVSHYFTHGWREGRNPSAEFDTSYYVLSNPDVAKSGKNPLYHYVRYGRVEGRLPLPPEASADSDAICTLVEVDVSAEVDPIYYLARNPDVAQSNADPVEHYVNWGMFENRRPNINFDVDFYSGVSRQFRAANQPPHHHYLASGRSLGLPKSRFSSGSKEFDKFCLLHGWNPSEVEQDLNDRRQDIISRLLAGELGDQLEKLAEIDPLVMSSFDAALDFQYSPFRSVGGLAKISAILELMAAVAWRRADVVVVLPWSRMGGASKLAGQACKVIVDRFGRDKVVVLHTATSEFDYPHWFPDGLRVADFHSAVAELSRDAGKRVLFEFLRAMQPALVLNINSKICWDVFEEYGRPLRESCKLSAYLFCHEVDDRGHKGGYPIRSYHRSLPYLDAVLVDSHALSNELKERFFLSGSGLSRLHVLPTPTDPTLPHVMVHNRSDRWRPNVYWAGRFVSQKRLDILREVATRMPDVNFHVWGGYDWPGSRPSNLYLRGLYQHIADLPLHDCDAWLYTSAWDGVPNVLIEVATLGIPIVGSVVGGTGEVLIEGMSVPIRDIDSIEAYVDGLRNVLADLPAARNCSAKLRSYILESRDPTQYSLAFNRVLEAIDVRREMDDDR